jgi:HSP20 family protein
MLMRSDPFGEFDRLADQLFRSPRAAAAMPIDAYRHGDEFVVHFDLPGVTPDSIDLTIEKNALRVTAVRKWGREDGTEVLVSERPQGTFSRQLFLGDNLDTDQIQASYDNGVLTITLPVADKAKPRKITVTQAAESPEPQSIETTSSAA